MKLRAAVIAGDTLFLQDINTYLSLHEFTVETFTSGPKAVSVNAINPFDIVILELSIPEQDILGIVRQLTLAEVRPGILMLSSYADEIDRVVALELGADDVVTKSISHREILARSRSISRRYVVIRSLYHSLSEIKKTTEDKYTRQGWRLNLPESSIVSPNGKVISLSRSELQILAAFLQKPGITFSRDELSSITNNGETANRPRHVDTIVARLRRKLTDGADEFFIITSPGVGYYCM
jgi:DNA-binding response OmpR family regulator